MIRVFHVYFPGRTLLLALSEALLAALAMLPAAIFVFGADAGRLMGYQDEMLKSLLVVAVCMLCMHYYDLYDSVVLFNPGQAATRVVQVLGSACVILAILYYLYPEARLNQEVLMVWTAVAGVLLIGWRRLFLALNRSARLTQKTLLVGGGALASQLAGLIEARPELGLRLVGWVDNEDHPVKPDSEPLGDFGDLPSLVKQHGIDRVIVTLENRRGRMPVDQLLEIKSGGVLVDDGPVFFEAVAGRVYIASLRPTMLLFSEGFRLSPLMALYKRAASIAGSLIAVAITLPIMALVALAIRLDSRGPVIFRQRRIGKDGKPFTLFKFRSMIDNADIDGKSRPATHDDDRVTRVGRFLRRSRLDELPQLFNILRGDMHFIGPRPFAMDQEAELAATIPFYSRRWSINPGATGWAQIRKGYNATVEDNIEKLAYDLYYIKNHSIGLDFLIVFETLKILVLGRGGR